MRPMSSVRPRSSKAVRRSRRRRWDADQGRIAPSVGASRLASCRHWDSASGREWGVGTWQVGRVSNQVCRMSWAATASRTARADLALRPVSRRRVSASREVRRSSARPTGRPKRFPKRSANFAAEGGEGVGRAVGVGREADHQLLRLPFGDQLGDGRQAVVVGLGVDDRSGMGLGQFAFAHRHADPLFPEIEGEHQPISAPAGPPWVAGIPAGRAERRAAQSRLISGVACHVESWEN